jgi:hypothetical protein
LRCPLDQGRDESFTGWQLFCAEPARVAILRRKVKNMGGRIFAINYEEAGQQRRRR